MARMSYTEQLKHPNWQRKRLETLSSAEFKCEECADKESTLHVHHKRYVKGRMAWEYEREELAVLCEDCHAAAHDVQAALATILTRKFSDWPMDEFVLGFLGGFLVHFRLVDAEESMQAFKVSQASYELGYLMAALGPDDMKAAVRKKIESGVIDGDSPMLKLILNGSEA